MLGICAARAEAEPMKQESKSCAREQELRKRARVARELRKSNCQELSKSKSCARVAQELSKSKPRSWGGGGAKEEANNTTPLR